MTNLTKEEDNARFEGLRKCMHHLWGFLDGVAIRCALDLQIPDIINNHNGPSRLMTFLTHKKTFDQLHHPESHEPLYALNRCSKWLLKDPKTTIAPLVEMYTDLQVMKGCYNLSKSIVKGGSMLMRTFGLDFWDYLCADREFSKVFNDGMSSRTRISMDVVLKSYKFNELKGSLVDVGGGNGAAIHEIVSSFPHLRGVNFDLPRVILCAPEYEGVTHVAGDMFDAIPPADSVFIKARPLLSQALEDGNFSSLVDARLQDNYDSTEMSRMIACAAVCVRHLARRRPPMSQASKKMNKQLKQMQALQEQSVLHNWSDDECVQILKNCRNSIAAKTGKIIIVDIILNPRGGDLLDDTHMDHDFLMLLAFDNGNERTEVEWKKILKEAGLKRYNIIKIPAIESIIEAYLD